MSSVDHLDGYIYHMIHFNNLQSIFQRRALLSKERVTQEALPYQSIASEEVQNLRDRIFIWDSIEQRYRRLHSYIPFYFATHTPMLYVQYQQGMQNEIIIFEVSRSILRNQGVLFTDGNASNQQLSRDRRERVGIKPATVSDQSCQRLYRPGGPHGTNPNCSDFYSDVIFLERLNWDVITDRWLNHDEKRRIRHAEVLVPDILPLGKVEGISVSTRNKVQAVNGIIEECGLTGRIPPATCKLGLFF